MSRLLYPLAVVLAGVVLLALGHPGLVIVLAVLVVAGELLDRRRKRQREASTAHINQHDRV